MVYIHGGGWTKGDKSERGPKKEFYLDKGISIAAINYRLTPENLLPAPAHDAARAIQFLRSQAVEWHIDTSRICLTGQSAGACTSMWLLCHDDLADPYGVDPVSREPTRVAGAAVSVGQTSIDPPQIENWLGPNVLKHRMIRMTVGEDSIEAMLENYEKHKALFIEFSPYNHVSQDDPSLFMSYREDMTLTSKGPGHGIHHPVHRVKMKEKADRVGMECHLAIGSGELHQSNQYNNARAFLFAKLLGEG